MRRQDCNGRVRRALHAVLITAAIALAPPFRGEIQWLDRLDEALYIESDSGAFRMDFSGLLDVEAYYVDGPPPGLVFTDDDILINPRLSLFTDVHWGERWYGFVQARFDRGFDPGLDEDGDARVDEYFVRFRASEGNQVQLQAGKFATVFGSWSRRHDSWHNPLITAPMAYEDVVPIPDQIAPGGRAGYLGWKNQDVAKGLWVPMIWGPSYASGAAVFGVVGEWDYAMEVKNAAISSRSAVWDPFERQWDDPTFSARLGMRPNAAWDMGMSASYGAYGQESFGATLPAGTDPGDYKQLTLGPDISWAWRHWQVWAEAFFARFEVPRIGDADMWSYYVETRRKLSPRWFVAARWNQQMFEDVADGMGGAEGWNHDSWRVDGGLGYKWDTRILTKAQYSYLRQGGDRRQSEHLIAAQLVVRF